MISTENKTIGQIVAEDFRTSQIFRSYGLDFCCGGKVSLEKACEKKNIDYNLVKSELSSLSHTSPENNYLNWSADFLIEYILNNHHTFVRKMIPEISFYADKVAGVHGERNPNLIQIRDHFETLGAELITHLEFEEENLFPKIKERATTSPEELNEVLASMIDDHEEAGKLMEKISKLSNGFKPPEDACASYQVLFQNLNSFEIDLHKHVHLENNILYNKVKEYLLSSFQA